MLTAENLRPTGVCFIAAERREADPYLNFYLDLYIPAYRAELTTSSKPSRQERSPNLASPTDVRHLHSPTPSARAFARARSSE